MICEWPMPSCRIFALIPSSAARSLAAKGKAATATMPVATTKALTCIPFLHE